MSAALFVATGSFFMGQQKFLPEPIRGTFIPMLPVFAVLALLIFWMFRVRLSRAFRPQAVAAMLCALIGAGVMLSGSDAEARPYRAPRTSFGAPDLQGLWTNSSVTMLQRPPIFKNLIATDKEAAMMEGGFKMMVADLISTAPIDPSLPAPPVVDEAPQSDILEMDMHLARIDGQIRSSWIVEPADGRIPFTDVGKTAARAAVDDTLDGPETRPTEERCRQDRPPRRPRSRPGRDPSLDGRLRRLVGRRHAGRRDYQLQSLQPCRQSRRRLRLVGRRKADRAVHPDG